MKTTHIQNPIITALLSVLFFTATPAWSQAIDTRIGKFDLELGVPTKASAEKLFDDMDFQRACQAYLWALPSVGFEYVLREQRNVLGAKNGDVVIYKGYQNVGRFLTPNVTTPYSLYFYCTIDCDVSVKSA